MSVFISSACLDTIVSDRVKHYRITLISVFSFLLFANTSHVPILFLVAWAFVISDLPAGFLQNNRDLVPLSRYGCKVNTWLLVEVTQILIERLVNRLSGICSSVDMLLVVFWIVHMSRHYVTCHISPILIMVW
jgi:hypothetical protein